MSLPLIVLAVLAVLVSGYALYGRLVARWLGLDDTRVTPAHSQSDGVDYVPTRPFYLFAQHFSAIAAAGPIVGPIMACQSFGWLPCLLWIALGVVLIGAVHDATTLAASVRHGARSVAEICREEVGPRAGIAMLAFIWLALMFVIVAFADTTAGTFVTGPEELAGLTPGFHPGGAVAAAAVMYLLLSVVMGVLQRLVSPPLWLMTLLFVPATFGVAWLGTHLSEALLVDRRTWGLLILAYCGVASVVPVWALLQPRGYLGGFVLYAALAIGLLGIFCGGYTVQQPAFGGSHAGEAGGSLFPFLFVTIACGACSGFHGLVCSGTTSKQIDRESHARPVGYGAMLAEGLVAVIALTTIMILTPAEAKGLQPGAIYGQGIGRFLTLLIGKDNLAFAITFGAMAFSTFVFDTLDVSTRLGRLILQELFGWKGRAGAAAATVITLAVPAWLLLFGPGGGWRLYWTLFGASNQLLAALSLLVVTVWLARARRPVAFTLLPLVFVLVITLWSLVSLALDGLRKAQGLDASAINALVAATLVLLALYLVARALARLMAERRAPEAAS
ncbi:MAG TPA: carbon starvation CstA family protein [Planctomycetota bacterium]|nr:carbon starvation CstA family protein [Planctomycetota bacterium]